jgi:uncharacterized protein
VTILSIDSNILLYAFDKQCPEHEVAFEFVCAQACNHELAICELVLVELYVLLRNPAILRRPLSPADAVTVVQGYRSNRHWSVIEFSQGVMKEVWALAGDNDFGRRCVFDARLAFTLRRAGVTQFATRNTAHFANFGFERVWDPLKQSA